ncbi:DUF6476 family protein [Maritimibacter sp. DP1N21-5]|uniref:DUF6476 family protein n=1 Tax=Maritimibacter sp. DP1N21-5 TaxID=2836867 RepID=UPI001C469C55|nr:DUF6476 family protein [Maritimibacter sp. DP1N21-5]MBV7410200.1 hypothetical protein [Maritimibacter sp. DP1N21-5]
MNEAPLTGPDAALVRYLKWLVTTLTVVMIVGLVVLIALVAMRFNQSSTGPAFPESIALPEGVTASAVTRGPDFLAVVSTDGRIFIFDPHGQMLRQEIVATQTDE